VAVLVAIAGLPLDIITLILVAIGTFIGAATWFAASADRRARQRKDEKIKDLEDNPFTHPQCWIKRAGKPVLADWWQGEITSSEVDDRDPNYKASGDVLALAKGQHFIYIQALARMGARGNRLTSGNSGNRTRLLPDNTIHNPGTTNPGCTASPQTLVAVLGIKERLPHPQGVHLEGRQPHFGV